MKPLLSDYIFDSHLRYEGHKMFYTPEEGDPLVLGGILGAAFLCVRLLNTDEQKERGFSLNEELHYEPFFAQYDEEVIPDDWGYMEAELEQLDLAYLELYSNDRISIETVCPNKRQLSIAMDMVSTYMHRIATERYGAHIYDLVPWTPPFAQWLFDAAHAEAQRQRFLQTDWTDPAMVHALAEEMSNDRSPMPDDLSPLFVFDGEEAADIMAGYWNWLWNFAQKEASLYPDATAVMADYKQLIQKEETDYGFIEPEMKAFTPDQTALFRKWMTQWTEFVNAKLKPEKAVPFWTKSVTEEEQEALLDYIKIRERQPQRYKCLAVAVYALRQLGYVTYNISAPGIAKWLSSRLLNDYTSKTGLYQFRRAWNDLSRYDVAVKEEVEYLAEYGVKSIK